MARWSPYDNNGGTCVAVAGADYAVIASDTRMSTGFSILSRESSKMIKLSEKCVVASSGFQADMRALQKTLMARQTIFEHDHKSSMSCDAAARLLSNTLYMKRFFPYYTFNICAGIDEDGVGAVYTYDAVGSYERTNYSCQGSGQGLIMPVLDNQLKAVSPLVLPAVSSATPLTSAEAVDLVKDTFATAAERDIYTVRPTAHARRRPGGVCTGSAGGGAGERERAADVASDGRAFPPSRRTMHARTPGRATASRFASSTPTASRRSSWL